MALISELVEPTDNFIIYGDRIASILAAESVSQYQKAINDGQPDPELWQFEVYADLNNPIERFRLMDDDPSRFVPIVNVRYSDSNFDGRQSTQAGRHGLGSVYDIDCYGVRVAEGDDTSHESGDVLAAEDAKRICALVKKYITSPNHAFLEYREEGVHKVKPQGRQMYRVQSDETGSPDAMLCRLQLVIEHSECTPEVSPFTLEGIDHDVYKQSDGKFLLTISQDYPIS